MSMRRIRIESQKGDARVGERMGKRRKEEERGENKKTWKEKKAKKREENEHKRIDGHGGIWVRWALGMGVH